LGCSVGAARGLRLDGLNGTYASYDWNMVRRDRSTRESRPRRWSTSAIPHWTIWLDSERRGERVTLLSALELVGDVAAVHRKPAWLLDETGYPLKPIERGATSTELTHLATPVSS
jgi:hypothetical protein